MIDIIHIVPLSISFSRDDPCTLGSVDVYGSIWTKYLVGICTFTLFVPLCVCVYFEFGLSLCICLVKDVTVPVVPFATLHVFQNQCFFALIFNLSCEA